MNRLRSLFSLSIVLAILGACSGGNVTSNLPPSVTTQTHGRIVAPTGDTESELRANIAQAQAAGDTVRVVNVTDGSATHMFSPYALIVRSSKALIVFAYKQVFVWRLDRMSVSYGGTTVALNTLPSVATPTLDAQVTSQGTVRRPRARAAYCPDCALLYSAQNEKVAQIGRGLQDAWQVNPEYVAFQSTAKTRAPQFITPFGYKSRCQISPGAASCYLPYGGGGGSGGGGASTGSTCATQVPSVFATPGFTSVPAGLKYQAPIPGKLTAVGFTYVVPVNTFSVNTAVHFFLPDGASGEAARGTSAVITRTSSTFVDKVVDSDQQWSSTHGVFSLSSSSVVLYSGVMSSHC